MDQRRLGGGDGGCNALGVCTVQFLADGAELTLLELADLDPAPPWAARMTAAYISFSIGRSPNACGMIFVMVLTTSYLAIAPARVAELMREVGFTDVERVG